MATFKLFHEWGGNVNKKVFNMNTDAMYIILSNTAPTQSTGSVYTDITQIATGNGYTQFAGSAPTHALAGVSLAETGAGTGVWRFTSSDFVFTASGGSIATFRYIAIGSDTAASNELIGYLDYGSAVDVTTGNTFTVDVGANGWYELTIP